MPKPRNNAGAVAAAVERPNIFAAPVSHVAGGARRRRPDHVFDAAAACDPTHLAVAGRGRTDREQSAAGRIAALIDVGSIRAVLLIGVAAAIVAALVVNLSPVRDQPTAPGSPTVPTTRDPAPAPSGPLRPAARAPRPTPIRRARARKRSERPAHSRRDNRPRRRPAQPAPRVAPAPSPRFVPPSRSVPHRPVQPRFPRRVPAGAPPEFM